MKNSVFLIAFSLFSVLGFSQLNMQQIGHLPYSNDLSDVWGYVDSEGNEYALVGVYNGFSIVSLADPANPVEVFFGPGPNSIWRDIKTWGDYAYVSNESGGGVYIVDLSPLPDGPITNTTNYNGETYGFSTIHNLYIDEFGKLYIFGANNGNGGAIICDLTQDPMNPLELGRFNNYYLHDGMARGDTLWGAGLYEGVLAAIDVSNPANPQIMGTVSTPSQFTHNTWVSDDGTHVYTTDEVNSGFVGAFNVTDLGNMYETDRVRASTGNNVIPHNVHVANDFLVTSYYTSGIIVHDANFPDKLFEVANFDTSPNYSGGTFNGCWGAYPFLPSGLILATDIEEGLYILDIDYIRAAYVEGFVRDMETNTPIFNVQVQVLDAGLSTQTNFGGYYTFGTLLSGTYDIRFSATGYHELIVTDVEIVNGEIVELNVELDDYVVGLAESTNSKAKLRAYPNPFGQSSTIEYAFGTEHLSYEILIHNSLGVELLREKLNNQSGSFRLANDLPVGVYLVSLIANKELIAKELLVKY
jgi:choice-of-anchor B domain-containing protein